LINICHCFIILDLKLRTPTSSCSSNPNPSQKWWWDFHRQKLQQSPSNWRGSTSWRRVSTVPLPAGLKMAQLATLWRFLVQHEILKIFFNINFNLHMYTPFFRNGEFIIAEFNSPRKKNISKIDAVIQIIISN
jgi:hypothetical protein